MARLGQRAWQRQKQKPSDRHAIVIIRRPDGDNPAPILLLQGPLGQQPRGGGRERQYLPVHRLLSLWHAFPRQALATAGDPSAIQVQW